MYTGKIAKSTVHAQGKSYSQKRPKVRKDLNADLRKDLNADPWHRDNLQQ